jgi:phage terminase Nu1 subunit (DNA packaging protein)
MNEWWSLTRTQLAQMLKVSPATIGTAIDDGAPGVKERGGRGKSARIDSRQFVVWWIEREKAKLGSANNKPVKAHERETEVDIRLKELKFARESDQVLARADALFVVRDVFTQLNSAMESMPRRDAHRVLNLKEMVDAVEALTAIADQIRADLRVPERWLPVEDEAPDESGAEEAA